MMKHVDVVTDIHTHIRIHRGGRDQGKKSDMCEREVFFPFFFVILAFFCLDFFSECMHW